VAEDRNPFAAWVVDSAPGEEERLAWAAVHLHREPLVVPAGLAQGAEPPSVDGPAAAQPVESQAEARELRVAWNSKE